MGYNSYITHMHACTCLLSGRHYVSCMPVDATVTGTLQEGPANRAMALALCAFKGEQHLLLRRVFSRRNLMVEAVDDVGSFVFYWCVTPMHPELAPSLGVVVPAGRVIRGVRCESDYGPSYADTLLLP